MAGCRGFRRGFGKEDTHEKSIRDDDWWSREMDSCRWWELSGFVENCGELSGAIPSESVQFGKAQ
jgi:hypothetical protein